VNRVTTLHSIRERLFHRRHETRRLPKTVALATLDRIIKDLEGLNHSTERDFLAVGEKLSIFRSTARQISSDMALVAELISGEHANNAAQALTITLVHSRQTGARIEQSCQALTSVRELSSQLQRGFAGLPNMVSIFRTLCTMTRIETSRLGGEGADLSHLTAEVRPLSESIQSSGERVIEASGRLDQEVQSAIRTGEELRIAQNKELPALIASVLDSLGELEQRRQLALESSSRQAAQYTAICQALEGVVESIQFHDITRQQVEHVAGALRQLRSAWTTGGESRDPRVGDSRAVLTLQSSQLAEAARIFASSVEQLQGDLASIAQRMESASESIRALTGISGDDRDSFFLKMENQFSAILKMLGACQAAQAEMDSTGSGLEQTIATMRDSVAEIRGTEIQIQRISTNATIRATHLGAAGVALNKIAEVMQRLALESNANTEQVAAMLDQMTGAAARVSGPENDAPGAKTVTPGVAEQMQQAIGELHGSSESSFRRVDEIAGLGSQLAQDIAAIRASFQAGRIFEETVDRARADLKTLGAHDGPASLEALGADATQHLEALAQTYTMQRQRDVHRSIVQAASISGATSVPAVRPPPSEVSGDAGLGDNVELF